MQLKDIFIIHNGLASGQLTISEFKDEINDIAYIRPTSSWTNLIVGYASSTDVNEKYVYDEDTLVVSTNGEGSHSYAYVIPYKSIPNSDMVALIPIKPMTLHEKIFYAMCITKNRFKFSYGRKPKGKKLSSLVLPDIAPKWINNSIIDDSIYNFEGSTTKKIQNLDLCVITDVFNIFSGNKFDLNKMVIADANDEESVAFVSRTARNLGVLNHVERLERKEPFSSGSITVALGGSILSSFAQLKPFYTGQNIAVLVPKRKMDISELIFYCMCIERNKFRYTAFGREANRTLKTLLIPKEKPKWINRKKISEKYEL